MKDQTREVLIENRSCMGCHRFIATPAFTGCRAGIWYVPHGQPVMEYMGTANTCPKWISKSDPVPMTESDRVQRAFAVSGGLKEPSDDPFHLIDACDKGCARIARDESGSERIWIDEAAVHIDVEYPGQWTAELVVPHTELRGANPFRMRLVDLVRIAYESGGA